MEIQGSGPGTDGPVYSEDPGVALRPLTFELRKDDGREAVFEALVDDSEAPGAPVYALTVTIASPGGDRSARADIDAFLKAILAGFIITDPFSEAHPPDDRDPLPDVRLETLLELRLVRLRTPDGIVGVTAVVRTTVLGEGSLAPIADAAAPGARIIEADVRERVLRGKDHMWKAAGGLKTATATARSNRGTIRSSTSQPKKITVGGGKQQVTGTTVYVHTDDSSCLYDFTGQFNGPTIL
jgi:hypothetical protein